MYFTIFAGVLIALSAEVAAGLEHAPSFNAAMTLLWTVVLVASAPLPGIVVSALVRPETLGDPAGRNRTLRLVRIGGIVSQAWVLGAFALATFAAGWPVFVEGFLRLRGWVLVDELMRLAPFFAMLVLSWLPAYRIDRSLRPGAWSLGEYVEFQVRQNLLTVMLPFVLVIAAADVIELLPWAERLNETGLSLVILAGLTALGYAFAPEALRRIWKTRRLEDGPLRERLEALSARAGVVSRDILVWETLGGRIPNACVVGSLPMTRYVMVTDALMDSLRAEEIEAVFAHELGHVKRRHITWYAVFAASLFAAFTAASALPAFREASGAPVGELLSLGGILWSAAAALAWGAGFGWLSRRMELEADLAAVALTNAGDFIGALERISFYGGRPRDAGSWRHFSIARRTGFLVSCEADPALRARFERRMRRVRVALAAAAALCLGAAALAILY